MPRKFPEKRKEWQRQYCLKRRYGMSVSDYDKMLEKQNKCCKLCAVHQDKLKHNMFVDHDHTTGIVRGLLCPRCNSGLGLLERIGLTRAIQYLKIGKVFGK